MSCRRYRREISGRTPTDHSKSAEDEQWLSSFASTVGRLEPAPPPQPPLLWIIREQVKLTGTKFGCGAGLCGACMVHIDGKRAFSCQTQLSEVEGRVVTTIEGLSPDSSHPVQKAW